VLLAVSVSAWAAPAGGSANERALGAATTGGASSDAGVTFHPELARLLAQWPKTRGGQSYTALRRMWQLWDRADPSEVEEALIAAGSTPGLAPGVAAYARVLQAYARLRRGDLEAAEKGMASLAYVDDWLVLGPFDNEGKSGFERADGPEQEPLGPIAFDRGYTGYGGRVVHWRRAPKVFPYGWVDLGALLRPEHPVCAYATSFVSQAELKAPRLISLWLGARGAVRLFWNGVERLSDPAYRGHDFDRRAALVWLEPGINRVTVKVCGADAGPLLSLRLADQNGAPDARLRWQADQATLSASAAPPPARKLPERPRLEGPLQWFERETAGAQVAAEQLEQFSRYLVVSDGDDPAQHRARDLAAQAATRAPSVPRLLLAADLSEDRNTRARWLEQAAQRPSASGAGEDRLLYLLARAEHLEEGLSPREALPLYQQALVIDPDNIDAIAGAARVLSAVGLERSALALVERALEREPHGVTLLNLYASGLEALGRTRDAEAARDLYSALRFDDHGPLVSRIDLALARREPERARHWAKRLLALMPYSSWAHGVAAHAEEELGQPNQALALYERALTLAPEDTDTLRAQADLAGDLKDKDQQLELLRKVLAEKPQAQEIRDYIDAIEPSAARPEESYAWAPERFLKERFDPPTGFHRRTLLDLNVTKVYDNGLSSRFRQIVFQPLTDTGAALGRQYSFVFQADRQRVQLKGARVYRQNGKVDEAIESGTGAADTPELTMYTSARTFYVQFPRLEPNDVVELRYRIDDSGDQSDFAGYFGELEYLQSDVPVRHAEYVVITPKSKALYVDAQRIPGLERKDELVGDDRVQRFWAERLPPINPEPNMPPWPEVLGFVHVSTYPSYEALGNWYWGLSKEQLELDAETKELVHRISAGAETTEQKVVAVYNWVIKNTRYVALEFGIYGYKPRRAVQTVARGWGDCKDKATVIVAMLRELGIDATLVVVRSGMRGRFDSTVASLAPFDHAIAYVPSLDLYLDGTAELAGSHELPAMDQAGLGLHVNQGASVLHKLPDNDPRTHRRVRTLEVDLAKDGAAELGLEYELSGPSASGFRQRYLAESTRRARVVEDMTAEFSGLALLPGEKGVRVSDLNQLEEPVRLSLHGHVTQMARRENERLSLSATLGTRLTPRYATLSARRLDLQIGAFPSADERVVIDLPRGFRLLAGPTPARVETPFGTYSVEVQEEPGRVTVRSTLSLSVSRVAAKDYAAFRSFCEAADAAFEPRLVLGPGAG
jgi:transglutaminase-like putative cysteine protease/Tfp pilus assembly protein PilF